MTRDVSSKWIARLMTCGVLGATALSGLSGCDTVARISFDDRTFDTVEVLGVSPAGGSCGGSDGTGVLRFVLLDADKKALNPDSTLENVQIELTRNSISIDEAVYYEMPDVVCESNDDCSADQAVCEVSDVTERGACQINSGSISVGSAPKFISELSKNQAFGVLVENSASMSGRLPKTLEGLALDYTSGDGGPDGIADQISSALYTLENPDRATDASNSRSALVSSMERPWETVASAAKVDHKTTTQFNLWTFGGNTNVLTPLTGGNWVSNPSGVVNAVNALREEPETNELASVYESIQAVIEGEDGFGSLGEDFDKSLVVIVDGPDDLRLGAVNSQTIGDLAAANNVKLYIIHIDSEVTTQTEGSGLPLLPDLPDYVAFQEECSTDSDCKNFEECRAVSTYSTRAGGDVTLPANKTSGTFCAIKRDENGRVGPIGDYAELACATGGQYFYVNSNEFLDARLSWLPYVMDGVWEVDVDFDAIKRGSAEPGEPYRVGASLNFEVGNDSKSFNMSSDFTDRRATLFSAGE